MRALSVGTSSKEQRSFKPQVTARGRSPQAHRRAQHRFKHHRECATWRCVRRANRLWWRHWIKLHPLPTATAVLTWYSTEGCDPTGGGGSTAMGTVPRFGEVASSVLALGTRIEVSPAILGRRDFTVEDRFGGQEASDRFDVWVHCGDGGAVPSTVRYRILR